MSCFASSSTSHLSRARLPRPRNGQRQTITQRLRSFRLRVVRESAHSMRGAMAALRATGTRASRSALTSSLAGVSGTRRLRVPEDTLRSRSLPMARSSCRLRRRRTTQTSREEHRPVPRTGAGCLRCRQLILRALPRLKAHEETGRNAATSRPRDTVLGETRASMTTASSPSGCRPAVPVGLRNSRVSSTSFLSVTSNP